MERRQAEFLVKARMPIDCLTRIGVISAARKAHVEGILESAGVTVRVDVMPDWYF